MRGKFVMVATIAVAAMGCGDGETTDRRGYTKAPLETPGLVIDAEERSAMHRLGVPNRPRGEPIAPPAAPDTAGG